MDPFASKTKPSVPPVLPDTSGWPLDADGVKVPPHYQDAPRAWMKLPVGYRRQYSEACAMTPVKPEKVRRAYAPNFTTDYAIAWGRKQGWKLIDRERYDARTQRHHDLEGEVDAIFDDGLTRVGVQGAGKSERKSHYERFMRWGGPEKARRRGLKILYLEFERGNKTPVLIEWWASAPTMLEWWQEL